MPTFRGKEFDEIRSWIFESGEYLYVIHDDELQDYFIMPDDKCSHETYADTTAAEAEHALRVLGCISGAFKTQGESNT